MAKKYRVTLSTQKREELTKLINKGKIAARKRTHAQILLHADEASETGWLTVERVRKRFVDSALNPRVQIHRKAKKIDGETEAFLIATACSSAQKDATVSRQID